MRKEIVDQPLEDAVPVNGWMDIEAHAQVRLTSESPHHPIESALRPADGEWRAAGPGAQTIWIDFDVPQPIREIRLQFDAAEKRTQEFVLLSSIDNGRSYQEIVRQQFNFSPDSTPTEEEKYFLHLAGVTDLKLTIIPDVSGSPVCASLRALRIR